MTPHIHKPQKKTKICFLPVEAQKVPLGNNLQH